MIGPRLGTSAFDKQQLLTESDGFLARAYANVFQYIQAHQSDMHVEVRASCCEIYHEQVTALHLFFACLLVLVTNITQCVSRCAANSLMAAFCCHAVLI